MKSIGAAETFMEVSDTMSAFKGRPTGVMAQVAPKRSGEPHAAGAGGGKRGGAGKKSD
jgi:hypothetical protein